MKPSQQSGPDWRSVNKRNRELQFGNAFNPLSIGCRHQLIRILSDAVLS